jgi:FKBP-type peptidyl-prolyl cis-trans isomerase SlyD
VIGMKIGESKDVEVLPEDSYGDIDEEAFITVSRTEFPEEMVLRVGMELNATDEEGKSQFSRVVSFDDENVNLDLNHPLVGKVLNFNVKIVALREATSEEVNHGHAHEDTPRRKE